MLPNLSATKLGSYPKPPVGVTLTGAPKRCATQKPLNKHSRAGSAQRIRKLWNGAIELSFGRFSGGSGEAVVCVLRETRMRSRSFRLLCYPRWGGADPATGLSDALDCDLHITLVHEAGKLLCPFD